MHGPTIPYSQDLHAKKYRAEGETFREAMNRIASSLKDSDEHFHTFRDILLNQRFLPAGRIQSSVGSPRQTTPYNCYVSGTIEDSFVDGDNSIMSMASRAAATMRMGGGIGYDFSTLRPRGDLIRKLDSQSSGPISFMKIYDEICKCVASSGHRRGAQMGVMRIDHPDIEAFIHAKQPPSHMQPLWDMVADLPEDHAGKSALIHALQSTLPLTGFNVSVGITDEFMRCLKDGRPFPLTFKGEVYREVDPSALWEALMRSTYDWAEPGVLFVDTINRMNNLWYCENIAATNPCGEQPLPPDGACLLGSFNLVKYLHRDVSEFVFHWDQFEQDIAPVVRAMDNVIDRARYPLLTQKLEATGKRRMGLGITGLANAAECMGMPYGSQEFLIFEAQVLDCLANFAYTASAELAGEKGSFAAFESEKYLSSWFIQSLRPSTREAIQRHGMRNSHLTSIAPTGTISLCADNVSSGIEPVFSHRVERTVTDFNGPRTDVLSDWAVHHHDVFGRTAADVTIKEHVDVLLVAATRVDSAVSKTCNVPSDIKWDDFKGIYTAVWEGGGKGCTTFRDGGKRSGVLKAVPKAQDGQACRIDPESGRRECD